jgi:aryl-alcohol dehydrogenase-like predicted oxidoreductase
MNSENNNGASVNRRTFLATGAALGASLVAPTARAAASKTSGVSEKKKEGQGMRRILGSGNSSLEVSTLGFGVMGMTYNRGPHPDRKELIKLLHQAVDRGVTLFDTGEIYGPFTNEELAGEALSAYKNKIAVTTKFGHEIVNGKGTGGVNSRPEHIRKVAEESLKRLKIDTIELFYQHRLDPKVPIEDVAGTIKDLIKEGKVKHYGLCEVSAETIRRAHKVEPLTAIQSEYHLMWRDPETKIFATLEELGIGFVPYSPINRGFLGGTLTEYTKFPATNDNRKDLPRFQPEAMRANLALVEVLNAFGRTRGATAAQIALAWHLAKRPWIVPIPGTTKLSHLEENLRAAEFKFSSEEWSNLEKDLAKIKIIGDRYNAAEQKKIET